MNKFRVMITASTTLRNNGAALGLHMQVVDHSSLEEAEKTVERIETQVSDSGVRYEAVRLY